MRAETLAKELGQQTVPFYPATYGVHIDGVISVAGALQKSSNTCRCPWSPRARWSISWKGRRCSQMCRMKPSPRRRQGGLLEISRLNKSLYAMVDRSPLHDMHSPAGAAITV